MKKAVKSEVIEKFKTSEKDTGSPQVQVGLLTKKIEYLASHLKTHKGDKSARRGLISMVSARAKHFRYIVKEEGQKTADGLKRKLGL